jgi:hypothetical protein
VGGGRVVHPFALGEREFVIEKVGRQDRLREYDPPHAKPKRPLREVHPEPIRDPVVVAQAAIDEMVARLSTVRR